MKKIIISLAVLSLLLSGGVAYAQVQTLQACKLKTGVTVGDSSYPAGTAVGDTALDQKSRDVDGDGTPETITGDSDWGAFCLIDKINSIVSWIVIFALAISVALVAAGGIMFMASGANPDMRKNATNILTWAVIGLVITGFAFVVPGIISAILGL